MLRTSRNRDRDLTESFPGARTTERAVQLAPIPARIVRGGPESRIGEQRIRPLAPEAS
jgi:hypothetical protein